MIAFWVFLYFAVGVAVTIVLGAISFDSDSLSDTENGDGVLGVVLLWPIVIFVWAFIVGVDAASRTLRRMSMNVRNVYLQYSKRRPKK